MRPPMLLPLLALAACAAPAAPPQGGPAGTFPRTMILPQAGDQWSFQVDGREWLRYVAGPENPKPFFHPVIGPSGRPVTRITHPRDPHTHAHHLSLWIGHNDVAGSNFWEHLRSPARIVHDHVTKIEDGDPASITIRAKWLDGERKLLLLDERTWTLTPRFGTIGAHGHGEFTLDLALKLTPAAPTLTLGKSNFGMVAVRVAKTMGTIDGGGTILNNEGKVNEKELMPHRRARWCDYSGQAAPGEVNGIALFDHPGNPNHPSYFHVRGDGWIGSSLTFEAPIEISREKPLTLRYRFLVHRGGADPKRLDAEWESWSKS